MEKIASCIKETGNWGSAITKELRMDNPNFDPKKVKEILGNASPKLKNLIENIQALDAKDLKKHGKTFKHFIYSDIKSAYGAKLIASVLSAYGFHHAYKLKKTPRGMSFGLDLDSRHSNNTFAILTSVAFYEKPIGVQFRRELLRTFNQRPDNNYGNNIRIMVLDSGFREGVDLFDVKYVHLMEPITTLNDQKQAVGRATRFCGQKGLNFDPVRGWPLHVFRYETTIPEDIQNDFSLQLPDLKDTQTFFQLFLKYSNLDPKKIAFANELERVVIDGAADKDYTKNLHEFKVGGKSEYHWPKVKVENLCVTPGEAPKGASVVTFSPTQNFIRETFTPKNPRHGMLLFHSVGTGKTCTAIATASTSFEPEGYTLLYVTRYTLKPDVWKNMFDQVCSVVVQDYLNKGKTLPEAQAAKLRLISKKWFEPMSYRQLSNMLDGKNKLSHELIGLNGKKDPLHKTLLIIDEAHKLFAADVEGQEKADIEVIQKALRHSYDISGKDSVKVLMMTATPYTSDAMDMIRLLNLIMKKPFPEVFEDFSKEYLNDEGKFSEDGLNQFQAEMDGMVSYLNREKDIRSFAYPIFKDISVPMSTYSFLSDLDEYWKESIALKGKWNDFNNDKGYLKQELFEHRQMLEKVMNMYLTIDQTNLAVCEKELDKYKERESKLRVEYKKKQHACKHHQADCEKQLKTEFKNLEKQWKAELKEASKKKTKEEKIELKDMYQKKVKNAQMDLEFDLLECQKDINIAECEAKASRWLNQELDDLNKHKEKQNDKCKIYKDVYDAKKGKELLKIDASVQKLKEEIQSRHKITENILNKRQSAFDEQKKALDLKVKNDVSQQMGVEKCLKKMKYKPKYEQLLSGKVTIEDIIDEEETGDEKVYLISGHGGEDIVDFKKRMTVPNNKVLVLFPECGRYNYIATSCRFQDIFSNPTKRPWLRNPIKYKSQIENELQRQIRIYLPGEKLPKMTTNLFLNVTKDQIVIAKSGVFRQFSSIDRKKFKQPPPHLNLGSPQCLKYAGLIKNSLEYSTDIHREVFKGNVYPPASKGDSYDVLEHRSFPLEKIMKDVGDGIYYYTGCRYSAHLPSNYEDIIRMSEEQQDAKDREVRIGSLPRKLLGVNEEEVEIEEIEEKKKEVEKDLDKKERKKPIKLDKTTKANLEKLSEKIQAFYKEILEDSSWIGKITQAKQLKLEKWKKSLTTFAEVPLQKRMLDLLEWMEVILTTEEPKEVLSMEQLKDSIQLTIGYEFVKNKSKKVLFDKIYGLIPKNLYYEKDKCNAHTLAKRIQLLFHQNKRLTIPYKIQDWNDSNTHAICELSREMLTKGS